MILERVNYEESDLPVVMPANAIDTANFINLFICCCYPYLLFAVIVTPPPPLPPYLCICTIRVCMLG